MCFYTILRCYFSKSGSMEMAFLSIIYVTFKLKWLPTTKKCQQTNTNVFVDKISTSFCVVSNDYCCCSFHSYFWHILSAFLKLYFLSLSFLTTFKYKNSLSGGVISFSTVVKHGIQGGIAACFCACKCARVEQGSTWHANDPLPTKLGTTHFRSHEITEHSPTHIQIVIYVHYLCAFGLSWLIYRLQTHLGFQGGLVHLGIDWFSSPDSLIK